MTGAYAPAAAATKMVIVTTRIVMNHFRGVEKLSGFSGSPCSKSTYVFFEDILDKPLDNPDTCDRAAVITGSTVVSSESRNERPSASAILARFSLAQFVSLSWERAVPSAIELTFSRSAIARWTSKMHQSKVVEHQCFCSKTGGHGPGMIGN